MSIGLSYKDKYQIIYLIKSSEILFVFQIKHAKIKNSKSDMLFFILFSKSSMSKSKIRNLTCSFSFYFQNQACQNQKFEI